MSASPGRSESSALGLGCLGCPFSLGEPTGPAPSALCAPVSPHVPGRSEGLYVTTQSVQSVWVVMAVLVLHGWYLCTAALSHDKSLQYCGVSETGENNCDQESC